MIKRIIDLLIVVAVFAVLTGGALYLVRRDRLYIEAIHLVCTTPDGIVEVRGARTGPSIRSDTLTWIDLDGARQTRSLRRPYSCSTRQEK